VGCGETRPKAALLRLGLDGDRVIADPAASRPGRGAYVCDQACFDAAVARRALSRAFRRSVDAGPGLTNLLESVQI
jgi:predicted RNA-binding protein YlxR (DUF448 family)